MPPVIRELLQIPVSPAPFPRRSTRTRVDGTSRWRLAAARRLPPGPPPPRSWTNQTPASTVPGSELLTSHLTSLNRCQDPILPGVPSPEASSLLGIVLRRIALNWHFHREYDHSHLYFLPIHLKPELIRLIGSVNGGITRSDLRIILHPPEDSFFEAIGSPAPDSPGELISSLDLTGSVGRSIGLKEALDLFFPVAATQGQAEVQESWDSADAISAIPMPVLSAVLTHLSLAQLPELPSDVSWKQLLTHGPALTAVTHLSLAFWPTPCLTPRARDATVVNSQGQRIPYGGTQLYSHSLDDDWSEALVVLKIFSRNLYKLEYLDITGCSSWFRALMAESEHDKVDWVGNWGKITQIQMYSGWSLTEDAQPSEKLAYRKASETARSIERHIRSARGGKGRFITIDRDTID